MGNLMGLAVLAVGVLLVWVGITGKFDGIVAAFGIRNVSSASPQTPQAPTANTGGNGGAPISPYIPGPIPGGIASGGVPLAPNLPGGVLL